MSWDKLYENCKLCPRACGVNRLAGQVGFCGQTAELLIARAALHMWEEPCISGSAGSGAVFFNGCSLGCIYCQNYEISGTGMQALREDHGRNVTREHLVTLFLGLQEQGAANINLVTATQFLPHIVWAIPKAREAGLTIPIVYNTSGYETAAQLRQLTGLVDCYLPDFKYMNGDIARQYSKAADYPQQVKEALAEMVGQTGPAVFDEKGMLQKGVIVRHLVLPGQKEQAKDIIRYLHETYGDQIWLSILNQYTPMPAVQGDPVLKRKLTTYEYEQVIAYALELGVEQAYRQEGNAAAESFIPSFHGEGVE